MKHKMNLEELKTFGKIYEELDTLIRDIFDWWINECLPEKFEDFDEDELYEMNDWMAYKNGISITYESIDFMGCPISFPAIPFEVIANNTWKEYLEKETEKRIKEEWQDF